MKPNENGTQMDGAVHSRREFLRVSGTLAAAGAMAGAGCQPPQETTIPFHDMPESLVDGVGRARFYATVLDGSPVLVRTREGRPIPVEDRVRYRYDSAVVADRCLALSGKMLKGVGSGGI